jgi:hypothetical protein
MYIGTSIFMIAVGAILAFAVNARVAGVDINTAGLILMLAGALGLLISLMQELVWSDRRRGRAAEPDLVREREYR